MASVNYMAYNIIKSKEVIIMEFVTLNNGVKMPLEGYGVFQVTDRLNAKGLCLKPSLPAIASSTLRLRT